MANKKLHMVTFILLVIGGLNWGLEIFGWGIGRFLGGNLTIVAQIIYALVALSAIYEIAIHKQVCKMCSQRGGGGSMSASSSSESGGGSEL